MLVKCDIFIYTSGGNIISVKAFPTIFVILNDQFEMHIFGKMFHVSNILLTDSDVQKHKINLIDIHVVVLIIALNYIFNVQMYYVRYVDSKFKICNTVFILIRLLLSLSRFDPSLLIRLCF